MDNYMLKNATIILEDFSKGIVAHQEDQIQSIDWLTAVSHQKPKNSEPVGPFRNGSIH